MKRDDLMGFSGRSRKPQMGLAEKFNIKEYPSPAGGCLLTDVVFSRRLRDLLSSQPHFELSEIELLKLGRHFYGCDINPEYVELANKRIEKARLEMAQLSFSV